jgi:hypothetical protein
MALQATDGSDVAIEAHRIEFTANPTQLAFIEARSEADMWAARKGEGKSTGLVWACFHHQRENRGAHDYILRDTFVNLRDSTMIEFFKWFKPGIFGTYNEARRVWKWTMGEMHGCEVHFIGLDDKSDANKIASRPMAGAFFDEVAPAVAESGGIDEENFNAVASQIRQSGVKWYACKIAQNSPDESHWTYRLFVDPGMAGYNYWRSEQPENVKNLRPDYYQNMRKRFESSGRHDLVKRMVEGKWGFQSIGKHVTPEWSDELHLATGLSAIPGCTLYLCWDFGLNPTCLVTQVSPLGHWNFLYSFVGDGIGATQLIEGEVAPLLNTKLRGYTWEHIGDRTGQNAEQSDSRNSAVRVIQRLLGGKFHPGPDAIDARVEPLRTVLRRVNNGTGVVQVDRHHAREVWHALRGGWCRPIGRGGIVSGEIMKNIHSHPADAAGYGASYLFPLSQLQKPRGGSLLMNAANRSGLSYNGPRNGLGNPRRRKPPAHGAFMR